MARFQGSITALITPFKNGAVDEQGFQRFVEWQIDERPLGVATVSGVRVMSPMRCLRRASERDWWRGRGEEPCCAVGCADMPQETRDSRHRDGPPRWARSATGSRGRP